MAPRPLRQTGQIAAVTRLLLAKGVFTEAELQRELGRVAPTGHQREREAAELQIELATERERIAQLRHEAGIAGDQYFRRLSFTPNESVVVAILRVMRTGVTRRRVRERLALASERGTEYSARHLSLLLHGIEAKLAAEEIVIERPNRSALYIGPEGQAKLTALELRSD